MRNHYHLALETPQGNLVAGMQWLQATFACRFNRYRGERGHLFQGRYKALIVEEGEPLARVGHYIHLNPVRAGIVPVSDLADYRYSSYWYLRRPEARPSELRLDLLLAQVKGLADTPAGWASYRDYLAWQAEESPTGASRAEGALSKGWALGSAGFKAALVRDHALVALSRAWETSGAREMRERNWEECYLQCLQKLNRNERDVLAAAKSALWKVAIAVVLKERTQASNLWLASRLNFGRAKYASRLVIASQRSPSPSAELTLLRGIWET